MWRKKKCRPSARPVTHSDSEEPREASRDSPLARNNPGVVKGAERKGKGSFRAHRLATFRDRIRAAKARGKESTWRPLPGPDLPRRNAHLPRAAGTCAESGTSAARAQSWRSYCSGAAAAAATAAPARASEGSARRSLPLPWRCAPPACLAAAAASAAAAAAATALPRRLPHQTSGAEKKPFGRSGRRQNVPSIYTGHRPSNEGTHPAPVLPRGSFSSPAPLPGLGQGSPALRSPPHSNMARSAQAHAPAVSLPDPLPSLLAFWALAAHSLALGHAEPWRRPGTGPSALGSSPHPSRPPRAPSQKIKLEPLLTLCAERRREPPPVAAPPCPRGFPAGRAPASSYSARNCEGCGPAGLEVEKGGRMGE